MSDDRDAGHSGVQTSRGWGGPELPRRRALKFLGGVLGAAAGAVAGLGGPTLGCGGSGDGASRPGADPSRGRTGGGGPVRHRVEIPLERLAGGERVRVTVGGRPVEVRRAGDRIVARSLLCTHFGCTVAWSEDRQLYVCPCHDGLYAPDGRVVGGPPSRPLPVLPVERSGEVVVVTAPEDVAGGGDGGGEGP